MELGKIRRLFDVGFIKVIASQPQQAIYEPFSGMSHDENTNKKLSEHTLVYRYIRLYVFFDSRGLLQCNSEKWKERKMKMALKGSLGCIGKLLTHELIKRTFTYAYKQ